MGGGLLCWGVSEIGKKNLQKLNSEMVHCFISQPVEATLSYDTREVLETPPSTDPGLSRKGKFNHFVPHLVSFSSTISPFLSNIDQWSRHDSILSLPISPMFFSFLHIADSLDAKHMRTYGGDLGGMSGIVIEYDYVLCQ